jgi:hypothetical protein
MRVLLVFLLVLAGVAMAATTLAYGHQVMSASVTAAAAHAAARTSEPAALLLSGSLLLGLAGALRRFTF